MSKQSSTTDAVGRAHAAADQRLNDQIVRGKPLAEVVDNLVPTRVTSGVPKGDYARREAIVSNHKPRK